VRGSLDRLRRGDPPSPDYSLRENPTSPASGARLPKTLTRISQGEFVLNAIQHKQQASVRTPQPVRILLHQLLRRAGTSRVASMRPGSARNQRTQLASRHLPLQQARSGRHFQKRALMPVREPLDASGAATSRRLRRDINL